MRLSPLLPLTALAFVVAACSAPPPAPAHPSLPNLHRLAPGLITGGAPAGDAGFDALVALGVRTIVSVDGAAPDVERAAAHGLRYVHVPVTYATVDDAQRLELARALRDLPGPVYVHCHHGKHRAPAAAAAAAVALGIVTPEQGVAYLRAAGTAPSYAGLFACVAAARVASDTELAAAPAELPPLRRPQGLTAAMVEADEAWARLGAIRAAGWQVPPAHPDLVPAAEAGRLTDDLRIGAQDPRAQDSDLAARLERATREAAALEEALVAGAAPALLESRWAALGQSCSDCHERHRDR